MSAKRAPRPIPRRGKPRRKGGTQRSFPYLGPEAHQKSLIENYRVAVQKHHDGAALVQCVRECQRRGEPVPDWVPPALELLLSDFVAVACARRDGIAARRGRFLAWARKWLRRYLDSAIATHLISSMEEYGLTWDEALDEAADWYAGTVAGGTPDALMKAYQRDRKSGSQRPETEWEIKVTSPLKLHLRPHRPDEWWMINADRRGERPGEWRERPRLLAKPRRPLKSRD